jgi:hypothetical protein
MDFYLLIPEVGGHDDGSGTVSARSTIAETDDAYSGVYRCRGLRRWCDERCDRYVQTAPEGHPEVGFYCDLHTHQRVVPGAYVPSRMKRHLTRRTSFELPAPPAAVEEEDAGGSRRKKGRKMTTLTSAPAATVVERIDGLRVAAEVMLARGIDRVESGETVTIGGDSVRVPRAIRASDVRARLVALGCADDDAAQRALERYETAGALRYVWRGSSGANESSDLVRFACDYLGIVAIPPPPLVAGAPTAAEDEAEKVDDAGVKVDELLSDLTGGTFGKGKHRAQFKDATSKLGKNLLSAMTGGEFGQGTHREKLKSALIARKDSKRQVFDAEAAVSKRVLSASVPPDELIAPATVRFAVVEAFALGGRVASERGRTANCFVRLAYRHRGALSLPATHVVKVGRTNTEWRDAAPTFNSKANGAPPWAALDAMGSKKSRSDFKASTGVSNLMEWPLGYIKAKGVPEGYVPPKLPPASHLAWTLRIPAPIAEALVPRGADAEFAVSNGVLNEAPPHLDWAPIDWKESTADFALDVMDQEGVGRRECIGRAYVDVRSLVDRSRGGAPAPMGPQSELYRWFPLHEPVAPALKAEEALLADLTAGKFGKGKHRAEIDAAASKITAGKFGAGKHRAQLKEASGKLGKQLRTAMTLGGRDGVVSGEAGSGGRGDGEADEGVESERRITGYVLVRCQLVFYSTR